MLDIAHKLAAASKFAKDSKVGPTVSEVRIRNHMGN